jgi:hypothetical protein
MIDELVRALPAIGGAAGMLLFARFVWSMSTEELGRLRSRLTRVERERDYFAMAAAAYRKALVNAGIEPPEIDPLPDA